ncbi:dihydropteroate synthase [Verrucomicrobiia bacterium DG1235]|nr:dihydropteroate synthase [Verrucomicrobiae bacterium DG1235]
MSKAIEWTVKDARVELGTRSVIVGILNATPDSFSDGGQVDSVESAVARALRMLDDGAGIIDVGGESTRPGFEPVSPEDEIGRVVPVIEDLIGKRPDCILSVDTSKAIVAEAALKAGARVVNDIWGFQFDPEMAAVAAASSAGVILMRNGRDGELGGSVLNRIRASWEKSLRLASAAGVAESAIALDPGVGFGTTRQEDLEILRGLEVLRSFGFPLMLGASRKRITAQPKGLPLEKRLEATLATSVAGVMAGVELFRVHDVAENARALDFSDLIYRGGRLDE